MPSRSTPWPARPAVLAAALALAGCAGAPFSQISGLFDRPDPAPARPAAPPPRPQAARPAPPADPQVAHYARIEGERRARGLMRTDDGTRDGPVAPARLAAIWAEVALRDEVRGGAPAPLRRWAAPVVVQVEFGPSVPPQVQAADRARVADLVGRLAEATRHPIQLAPAGAPGNFHLLVLAEAERRAIGPRLAALVPGLDADTQRLVETLPQDTFCLALAFARGGGSVYTEAVAVVRAEHPDLTRLACYHEELAQGLGLAADTPRARPSVFNDDQEFALLTALDLALLRLHYDPRLSPGLRAPEAAPLALAIARDLAAGES